MSEWKDIQLGDVCSKVITGGTPLTSIDDYYKDGKIPWLKTKEVNFNRIYETEFHITESGLKNSSAKLIPANSVIIAMYGQGDTAGRVAINKIPVSTNQACCNLIINSVLADFQYIYYYLKNSYTALVKSKTGSAQPNLNTKILKEFSIKVPPVENQRVIGKILTSIDDKIELLYTQNKDLEELAQTIYKHWFVDFEFPKENGEPYKSSSGKMVDSELGEIPEGWRISSLKEVCLKITDGTHSTVSDDVNGQYHLLSCKNIKKGEIIISVNDRRINKETLNQLRKRTQLSINDILLTTVGTIGEVAMIRETEIPFELQRSVAIIRPDKSKILPEFLYQFSRSRYFQHQAISRSEGSVQTCLFLGAINGVEIVLPPIQIMKKAELIFDSIYKRVYNNIKEVQTLTQLRETLLPKLMSGKLKVKA